MELKDIKTIACLGAGLIGSSWATSFAKSGYTVNVYDPFPESLEKVPERVRTNYQLFVDNGFMTAAEAEAALGRIHCFDSVADAVRDAQFIQENGPEVLETKQDLVAQIDAVNPTALVCSSTSGLNVSDIAAKSQYPQRYLGGHPYNPPHLMPLVEITQFDKTDKALVQVAFDFYKAIKKEPVILYKESPGFIGNRLQTAFAKEAIEIVMDGVCSVEDVDKAAVFGLGIRWAIIGPNLNGELNGGAGGVQNYFGGAFKKGFDRQFARLMRSEIKEMPMEYANEIAPKGVAEELANRDPATGNTAAEVAAYRDKILLGILGLLGKA